jgi:hypothetical protein
MRKVKPAMKRAMGLVDFKYWMVAPIRVSSPPMAMTTPARISTLSPEEMLRPARRIERQLGINSIGVLLFIFSYSMNALSISTLLSRSVNEMAQRSIDVCRSIADIPCVCVTSGCEAQR